MLLLVKRICHCYSDRHLGQSLTWNISPGHGSHPCWSFGWVDKIWTKGTCSSHPQPLLGKVKMLALAVTSNDHLLQFRELPAMFLWCGTFFWPKASFRLTVHGPLLKPSPMPEQKETPSRSALSDLSLIADLLEKMLLNWSNFCLKSLLFGIKSLIFTFLAFLTKQKIT